MKIMKQYRFDQETIKQIELIQKFMKKAYSVQEETLGMPKKDVSATDAVQYAIKALHDRIKTDYDNPEF